MYDRIVEYIENGKMYKNYQNVKFGAAVCDCGTP